MDIILLCHVDNVINGLHAIIVIMDMDWRYNEYENEIIAISDYITEHMNGRMTGEQVENMLLGVSIIDSAYADFLLKLANLLDDGLSMRAVESMIERLHVDYTEYVDADSLLIACIDNRAESVDDISNAIKGVIRDYDYNDFTCTDLEIYTLMMKDKSLIKLRELDAFIAGIGLHHDADKQARYGRLYFLNFPGFPRMTTDCVDVLNRIVDVATGTGLDTHDKSLPVVNVISEIIDFIIGFSCFSEYHIGDDALAEASIVCRTDAFRRGAMRMLKLAYGLQAYDYSDLNENDVASSVDFSCYLYSYSSYDYTGVMKDVYSDADIVRRFIMLGSSVYALRRAVMESSSCYKADTVTVAGLVEFMQALSAGYPVEYCLQACQTADMVRMNGVV